MNDSMWSVNLKKFEDNKHFHSRPLDSKTKSCWMLISSYAAVTKNLDKSKKYFNSIIDRTTDNYQLTIYEIFEYILNLYEENSYLFKQQNALTNTEYDYVGTTWAPLIRKIIYLNNNMIRLKMGETVNPISIRGKVIQYQSKHYTGIKMDFRFIVDVNRKEIDVGAGEAVSEEKIIHDEGKLVRESKDIVDGLIQYYINFSIDDLMGMIIQTSGLSGEISSFRAF